MKNIHKVSLLVALVGSLIALKAFNVSNGLQATHSQLDFENDTITVPGSSTGMNTGIVLPIGEHIEITAEGSVNTWPQEPTNPWGGPNGNGSLCTSECLMPAANFGALIGRLGGNGEWFLIGSYKAFFADVSDELIMAVNDTVHDDNIGSFTVSVRVGIIDNSLVGEYLFNEGTGSVINDTSGQERHGTIHGAQWVTSPILDNNGQPGYALQFNHTHASVPSDVLKHLPLSISLWVKPEGNVNDKRNNIISNDIPRHSGHGRAGQPALPASPEHPRDRAVQFTIGSPRRRDGRRLGGLPERAGTAGARSPLHTRARPSARCTGRAAGFRGQRF